MSEAMMGSPTAGQDDTTVMSLLKASVEGCNTFDEFERLLLSVSSDAGAYSNTIRNRYANFYRAIQIIKMQIEEASKLSASRSTDSNDYLDELLRDLYIRMVHNGSIQLSTGPQRVLIINRADDPVIYDKLTNLVARGTRRRDGPEFSQSS